MGERGRGGGGIVQRELSSFLSAGFSQTRPEGVNNQSYIVDFLTSVANTTPHLATVIYAIPPRQLLSCESFLTTLLFYTQGTLEAFSCLFSG